MTPDRARADAGAHLTRAQLRRLTAVVGVGVAAIVAYWALWALARPVVATSTTQGYVDFEQAFPPADAWLALTGLLAVLDAHRRRPTALLWLIAAGGAGVYLFCMDVSWDLQHGTYAAGAGGLVELCVNLLTLALAAWLLRWGWRHRAALLGVAASAAGAADPHR